MFDALVPAATLRGDRSTTVFRVLLAALAEPGTVHRLPAGVLPAPLPPAVVVPLALADLDSTVAVAGEGHDGPLGSLVRLATGADSAPVEAAAFVVDPHGDPCVPRQCRRGSALEPERGCRLAVAVTDLGRGAPVALSGPGVPGRRVVRVAGLRPAWFTALARANTDRPAGIDVWLVTGDGRVLAMPRSTRLEVVEPTTEPATAREER
jgi:alpha-D-ribose 1-methylphosphonate 5-triphosphate synthase subunit PhnH